MTGDGIPICGQGDGPWGGNPTRAVHPHVTHLAYIPGNGRTSQTGEGRLTIYPTWERVRCRVCGAVLEFAVNRDGHDDV